MITWLRENAALTSIAATVVLTISGGAIAYYKLNNLDAAQPAIQSHMHDTTKHIDPNRDPERLKKLEERVEQLERQLRWMNRRMDGNREDRRRER